MYSFRVITPTASASGFALSSAMGARMPTFTSCSRLSASLLPASSVSGRRRMKIESLVAMSLKGIPTTSLHPSCAYSLSGCCRSSSVTALRTDPSRLRRPRTSHVSDGSWEGRSTSLLEKVWKSRVVSSNSGTANCFCLASGVSLLLAMSASFPQGVSSYHGSSVSETLIVSPMPSCSSAPMPMALLMRPSSPSPASVTPRCMG
mmetsp:Transcript_14679/g.35001  ORF Transcript_14679/g.35001 Transcript_14679/m.35001 type:complete len:204 (-) Transcript_14679:1493-2104(-)